MGKLSLKTKSPMSSGLELFSTGTWVGIGAFAFLAGVTIVLVKAVSSKAESALKNPALTAYTELMG